MNEYERDDALRELEEAKIDEIRLARARLEFRFGVDIEIVGWDRFTDLYTFQVWHPDYEYDPFSVYGTLADLEERL